MSAFNYQALDNKGKTVNGIIEADTERLAKQLLKESDLLPIEVFKIENANKEKKLSFSGSIKATELALITRQLATLFRAQLPVEKSLHGVIEQTEKKKSKHILSSVRDKVLEGHSLSQALSNFPNSFPEIYCSTIAAGEQTGSLDIVLNRLADHTEQQLKTQQKIQQALIYPTIMILVSTGIISFLLSFVVPKIVNVFNSTGQTLPELTRYLISLSQFVKQYGLIALFILAIGIFGFKQSLRKEIIRLHWHRLLLKLPLISYLSRTTNTARYAHTLAILSGAGVPILKAMDVAAKLVTILPIKYAVQKAKLKVQEGGSISKSLKSTSYFSPMAIHLIASGESSGSIEEMLNHAALTQDDEVKRLIETSLTLFEPLIILIMGAVILFIVLATLLPIFTMDQLVG